MIPGASRQMIYWTGVFVLCQLVILFARLLPLSIGSVGWPGPDIGLCLTFAWVLRRPDRLPAIAIAAVMLFEDILLLRPLGLWAAIVLIASEYARVRESRWRDQSFIVEWLRVAALIGGVMLGYRIMTLLFFLPVPTLGTVTLQYLATMAAYPLVVFTARWLIGLRRISPVEAELKRYTR